MSEYQILTIKDICQIANVSEATAKRLKAQIIKELGLKRKQITLKHYKIYFCC